MLKKIIFLISTKNAAVTEAARYVAECGYETSIFLSTDFSTDYLIEEKENTLFLTDSPDESDKLCADGFFVVGLSLGQENDTFEGIKYVFTDIDEVDIDSYVKAYQRYAKEPWEVLRTERLLIRETTVEDVDAFYKLYKDPDMTKYMEGLFENPEDEKRYQKDYIEKVYELMGFGVWTVIRLSDNAIIGRAGYSVRNGFDEVELGFLIGKDYQNQGYAYKACSAILDYGRDVLLLPRCQALVKEQNAVSIHLLKKLGFKEDSTVEVEENIYGKEYGNGVRLSVGTTDVGRYVKMTNFLW